MRRRGGGGILNVKAKWDDWNEGGSGGGNKGEQVSQGMEAGDSTAAQHPPPTSRSYLTLKETDWAQIYCYRWALNPFLIN